MTIRQSKTNKFSDTQLVLLSAASQRQDRCLIRSESMTERAFARAVNALVKQGLVAAIDSPFRRAEDTPSVAITLAGMSAIGCPEPIEETRATTKTGRRETVQQVVAPPAEVARGQGQPTKRAQIIALLSREEGASLNDLMRVTHQQRGCEGLGDGAKLVLRVVPGTEVGVGDAVAVDRRDADAIKWTVQVRFHPRGERCITRHCRRKG